MEIEQIPLPKRVDEALFNLFCKYYEIYKLRTGKTIAIHKKDRTWVYIQKNEIAIILRVLCFNVKHEAVSNSVVNNVYEMIRAISDTCDDEIDSVEGLAQTNNSIIFDCGGEFYINLDLKEGCLQTLTKKKSKIVFLEKNSSKKEIIPNIKQSGRKYLKYLRKAFPNLPESVLLLFGVYLATLFIKNIHHPLVIISGEYGAAKTTFTRMIIRIIDPHIGDVTPMPKTLDDVATVIHNKYFVGFDNLSYISRELADFLCLVATGGSYQKRKLYTDTKVVTMQLHNPIVINGLNLAFPYSDLMDRAILLELPRINCENRLTEEEVWSKFYNLLPDIYGCIFRLILKANGIYRKIKLSETPRLADFAKWGYAIAESIDEGLGGEFLKQYKCNSELALKSAAESNPLLHSITSLMTNIDSWEGTATELLKLLEAELFKTTISTQLPRGFPTTANVLSRRLNTLQNDLKVLGYKIETGRDTDRYIRIVKIQED